MKIDIPCATEALRAAADSTPIRHWALINGGDTSRAAHLRTDQNNYFLKWGGHNLPDFFAAEAHGLALIAATNTLRVPKIYAWRDAPAGRGFILQEWLETAPAADRNTAAEQLGYQLAALHRITAPTYGLDTDTYIGATLQPNQPETSWITFFREHRLRHQMNLARRNGYLPTTRAHQLEHLLAHLDRWLDDHIPRPSLLHGDLWNGNWLIGPTGAPALIDPATFYGDRETDLALTTLFGNFPQPFYRAYTEAWPLPDGWQSRRDLYHLYHLLNHLNLFGTSYATHIDTILQHYISRIPPTHSIPR